MRQGRLTYVVSEHYHAANEGDGVDTGANYAPSLHQSRRDSGLLLLPALDQQPHYPQHSGNNK